MMGCIMTVVTTAGETQNLTGRWVVSSLETGIVPKKGRIFDFTRCGEAWCGVEVNKDGKCGRTAFHFSASKDNEPEYRFKGQFSASDQTKPFTLFMSVAGDANKIWANGYIGDVNPFERSFPLELELSRQGDAVCKADAKTS